MNQSVNNSHFNGNIILGAPSQSLGCPPNFSNFMYPDFVRTWIPECEISLPNSHTTLTLYQGQFTALAPRPLCRVGGRNAPVWLPASLSPPHHFKSSTSTCPHVPEPGVRAHIPAFPSTLPLPWEQCGQRGVGERQRFEICLGLTDDRAAY